MPNGGMPNGENDVLRAECPTSMGAYMPIWANRPNAVNDQHQRFILYELTPTFLGACD